MEGVHKNYAFIMESSTTNASSAERNSRKVIPEGTKKYGIHAGIRFQTKAKKETICRPFNLGRKPKQNEEKPAVPVIQITEHDQDKDKDAVLYAPQISENRSSLPERRHKRKSSVVVPSLYKLLDEVHGVDDDILTTYTGTVESDQKICRCTLTSPATGVRFCGVHISETIDVPLTNTRKAVETKGTDVNPAASFQKCNSVRMEHSMDNKAVSSESCAKGDVHSKTNDKTVVSKNVSLNPKDPDVMSKEPNGTNLVSIKPEAANVVSAKVDTSKAVSAKVDTSKAVSTKSDTNKDSDSKLTSIATTKQISSNVYKNPNVTYVVSKNRNVANVLSAKPKATHKAFSVPLRKSDGFSKPLPVNGDSAKPVATKAISTKSKISNEDVASHVRTNGFSKKPLPANGISTKHVAANGLSKKPTASLNNICTNKKTPNAIAVEKVCPAAPRKPHSGIAHSGMMFIPKKNRQLIVRVTVSLGSSDTVKSEEKKSIEKIIPENV